jgi:hypothetical protein
MPSLVQPLFDGPLDIVGDVHGEIDALRSLMGHLGYTDDGRHAEDRRLVFLGDLTDRGPNSPAVVELVSGLIASGRAQCILGNHDLNILLDNRKPENRWFWGEEFLDEYGRVAQQRLADAGIQQGVRSLFRRLPIALERDDLRVIHASWHDEMIQAARQSNDVVGLYEHHHGLIEQSFPGLDLDEIDRGLEHQNRNPVKRLTSGPEERSDVPIHSGGKIRNERRVHWWNDYSGPFCAFGHYSLSDEQPRGGRSAFCVDYGVGQRWTERRAGKANGFAHKLAAAQFPEKQVVFDEGSVCDFPASLSGRPAE